MIITVRKKTKEKGREKERRIIKKRKRTNVRYLKGAELLELTRTSAGRAGQNSFKNNAKAAAEARLGVICFLIMCLEELG